MIRRNIGAILFLCLAGLGAHALGQERIARIINGDPTTDFPSVGIVGSISQGEFCSGTLIGSRFVLTAAHCATTIGAVDEGTFAVDQRVFFTRDIHIHPNYNDTTLDHDIAILELEEEVTGITPSPIFRAIPVPNNILAIVGYGRGGDAGGSNTPFGTKRVGYVRIDLVTETQIIWDFDDPNEANTASGDSGGPGFLEVFGGELQVASVTSSGLKPDSSLGDRAYNVRVDYYASWIDGIVTDDPPPGDDDPPPGDDDPPPGDDDPPPDDDDPPPGDDDPPPDDDDPPPDDDDPPSDEDCPPAHWPVWSIEDWFEWVFEHHEQWAPPRRPGGYGHRPRPPKRPIGSVLPTGSNRYPSRRPTVELRRVGHR